MKNVSFGKEEDFPIPKRIEEDLNDDNDLDLDDENEQTENEIKNKNNISKENNKYSGKKYKEYELNPNDPKNKKKIFDSDSEEDEDSDKTNSDNEEEMKKTKNKNSNKKLKNNMNKEKEKEKRNKKEKIINKEKNKNKESDEEDEENEEKEDKSEEEEEEKVLRNKNIKTNNKNINEINNKEDKEEDYPKNKSKDKEIEDMLIESINNKENVTSQKIHMAEEINFKSIPSNIIKTDQFGFLIGDDNNDKNKSDENSSFSRSSDLLTINARMEKWNYMIKHYDEFYKKKFGKLKSRTRKGVPDCLRSQVWQLFAEKDKYYEPNLFNKLDAIQLDETLEITIIKDLDRTFPKCYFFKEKYGDGQRKLYKVLSYYSKYNTSTGYVQGMGFIVAVFLTYMDEEGSFYMLHSLMKKYGLEGFYQPGFPKLKGTFYVLLNLLKKFIPKVYEYFKTEGMIPSMYASEWFICLFSRNLEFDSLVRIFDVLFLEGYKVIYRFALAFLKLNEDRFLEGKDGLASIMNVFKEIDLNIDIDKLFTVAFGFSLSRKDIDKFEKEYNKVKDKQDNEFVQQL